MNDSHNKNIGRDLNELMNQQRSSVSFQQVWQAYEQRKDGKRSSAAFVKQKKWMVGTAAAAVAIIGIVSAGFVSPTFASMLQKIPFLGSYYQQGMITDRGWEEVDRLGLATGIHKAVTDQGITVTVTDVFYDGVRIAVGYDLQLTQDDSDGKDQQIPLLANSTIRDVKTDFIMTDGSNQRTGDRLYRGAITINTSTLPSDFTLDLDIESIGTKKGHWSFALPVSNKDLAKQVQQFQPNVVGKYKDFEIRVKKVTASPVSTEVLVEATGPTGTWDKINFSVQDDWGTALESAGGGGEELKKDAKTGRETLTHRLLFGPLGPANRKPEYLVLLPKISTPLKNSDFVQKEVVVDVKDKFPTTLDAGRMGKITILGIDFLKDKTLVRYEVDSLDHQFTMLSIQDGAGNQYGHMKWPQRLKKEPYEFQVEYPAISSREGLKFHAIFEEIKNDAKEKAAIKIPLAW